MTRVVRHGREAVIVEEGKSKPPGQRKRDAFAHAQRVGRFYRQGVIPRAAAAEWVERFRADGWEHAADTLAAEIREVDERDARVYAAIHAPLELRK